MNLCPCQHLGHCPLTWDSRAPNAFADLYTRTDLDGNTLWRAPDGCKPGEGVIVSTPESPEPRDEHSTMMLGGFVASDGEGTMMLVGQAIDPERAAAYGRSLRGCRCKATREKWAKKRPNPNVPRGDA